MNYPGKNLAPVSDPLAFLAGGGETGSLIRAMDWSKTALGPVTGWPQSLRTTVSICLASDLPICVIWGPGLVQLYNDAYRVICGGKHPQSMGQNFSECWKEAWPVIGEAHDSALAGDKAFLEVQQIFLERHGYVEECFFTFSFSPIRDEAGQVGGLFHPVIEMTTQMLNERRTRALRDLAFQTSQAKSVREALSLSAQSLAQYDLDLPFVLLYALEPDGDQARLVGATDLRAESVPESFWPLEEVVRSGAAVLINDLAGRIGPAGTYPESPGTALALPIILPGTDRPVAIFIAGISPRLPMNEAYRSFYDSLASSMTSAVINAGAYEDERRRTEALADIARAKTIFFSNVSHEFRTPLTLMLGPVKDALAASKEPLPPLQRERLELVQRNGLRLQSLVNNLLDFSRIEAGRVRAAYEPTALAELTADLASNFRSACERAGLTLRVDCPRLSEPAFVDRTMWEKIVLNLLSNAFKFTFDGEIAVSMRHTDDAAELRVRDTGTGIRSEDIPRLFERFYQVENAHGRTHEGSGIGLSLVQELVKLHGGAITVESKPGRGTTFTVSIPLGAQHLAGDQVGSGHTTVQPTMGASRFVEEALRWLPDANHELPLLRDAPPGDDRPLVLVADDNADMRQYIVRLLGQHYRTEAVPDGQMALAAALERTPDLILTDVMMPRLDGFALLHALRADPRTSDVPVIMLSARAGEESRIEGLEEGADDYLVKPFSARELLACVTAHLKMAKTRREAGESIRASEERFRALVSATSDVIYRMNADWTELRHLQGREFIADTHEPNRSWLEKYIPLEEQPRILEVIQVAIRSKGVFELEHRVMRVDGTLGWAFSRAIPMLDGHGQIKEWFGAASDVTARKQAEFAIRAEEERSRTILESITDGYFTLGSDWCITYINAAGERFLDRNPGELIGKSLWEEFPGTVGTEFERVYRRVAASQVGESFTAFYPNFDRWYELTASPAPKGLTVYFRDVTDERRSHEALRTLEEQRDLALSGAELGMWHVDPVTGATKTDARFRAIFGTTEEWTDYRQAVAIIHPDDQPAVLEAVAAATRLENPTPYAIEYRIVHPDGSVRWIFAKGRSSFEGAGGARRVTSFDGTVADISDRKASEDALKVSESRSRTILESITDGFYALDADWRFTYINASGQRMLDRTPGDLIGKTLWDEYPGVAGSEFEQMFRRVASGQGSESLTAFYPDLDRWYEVIAYPVAEGLSVYFRDVTGSRKIESERQQFAALVDASPDFIGVAGLDQRGVYINRAGEALIGLEPGQVSSIGIPDIFPESERARILSLVADSEGGKQVVVDTWFQHLQTGQLIPVSWSSLTLRDTSGNVSGYATVTRDLTERNKAESLLRVSEQRQRLALDAAELGMWHVDPATRATQTDARFRAIFGTTAEWTDYYQSFEVTHPDDLPAVQAAVAAAIRLEDTIPCAIEFRINHPDGSIHWVFAKGRSSFEGTGSTRRAVSFDGTVADITDRKRGEEERERLVARLQEQDQRKDEFLATLAHELRNPLAPIRNGLQIMRLAPGNADANEQIRLVMERQLGQMVHLIDDLLDLSRISRGKIDLRKERIELAKIIALAIETSRPSIDKSGHDLFIEVPPGPIFVDADLTRLTQVFSNLLNNAAKFTKPGGQLRLTVQLMGAEVVVSVTDNGIGIPAHMLQQVFEMFAQVESNLERSQSGLGIGLSIVQRLVQMHGGSVEARSNGPGSGSEFVVRLPVVLALVGNQPVDEPNTSRPTARLRILVADDNVDSVEILAMLLTLEGYDTKTTHDGDAALDVAATFRPDVILLDIGMPKLNGYEVCRRIRQQAWGKTMIVIAMTGWSQEDDRRKSHAAGFDFHLVKPVDLDVLYKLLAGVTVKVSWNIVREDKLIDDFGHDVTLQKQAPLQLNQTQEKLRQLQKADAAGQLIDGIAHDLNNLLQIISADLHLIMKQGAVSSDIETRVNSAQEAVKRGAKLASKLLALNISQTPEPK